MGCLRNSHSPKAELIVKDAGHLKKLLSVLIEISAEDAAVLSELRIFLTNNGKLKSISSFEVCYVNEHNFKIAKEELNALEAEGIGVFSGDPEKGNPVELIKRVCEMMGLQLVDTGTFVSEYIIPRLDKLTVKKQKKYLLSISKVDRATRAKLINQLKSVAFICKANSLEERVTADKLYSPSVELFRLCLSEYLLANEWGEDPVLIGVLNEIGFNQGVTLPILKDCAVLIADVKLDDKVKIEAFLKIFVDFVGSQLALCSQPTNILLLNAIAEIPFIPMKKILNITGSTLEFKEKLGDFRSALPHENMSACGMMCYIFPSIISDIPDYLKGHLRIISKPKLSSVVKHLEKLSQQCRDLSSQDMVEHQQLFYDSYAFLQQETEFDPEMITFTCIFNQGTLLDPMNLVFNIEEEIPPYLLKVPTTLLKYTAFLEQIGVQTSPTYQHFAEVLKLIYESADASSPLDTT